MSAEHLRLQNNLVTPFSSSFHFRYQRKLKEKEKEGIEGEWPRTEGIGPRKGDIQFGPPVVSDPGEGFGPPGSGPPKDNVVQSTPVAEAK